MLRSLAFTRCRIDRARCDTADIASQSVIQCASLVAYTFSIIAIHGVTIDVRDVRDWLLVSRIFHGLY